MKGDEFISFAGKIAALHSEEAANRSAISRAYYGAFHVAISLLKALGLNVDTKHDNVAIDFKAMRHVDAILVGRRLDTLRSARVKADYQLDNTNLCQPADARAAVERAIELADLIESLAKQLENVAIRDSALLAVREARQKSGRRA